MSLDVNISEPDEFNCSTLHESLEKVAKIKNIEDYSYHVESLSGNCHNFVANIFRVSIQNNKNNEHVNIIVKTLINNTRQILYHEIHEREVDFYKDIVPVFKNIQNDVSNEDKVIFLECIMLCKDKGNEIIISDDLTDEGFVTNTKTFGLEYDEISPIIEELAKFHALTIIFKQKHLNEFKNIAPKYKDLIYSDKFLNKAKLRSYFLDSFERSIDVIDNDEARKKLIIIKDKLLDLLRYYTRPKDFNVFCHGDLWLHNILINKQENRFCFVDFQTVRYSSPWTDFTFFLYLCTDSNFRQKYMKNLVENYCTTFRKFLALHNAKFDVLYGSEKAQIDLEEFQQFGLLIALIEIRSFTDDERGMSVSNISMGCGDNLPNQQSLFKIRVNDVIAEAVGNGALEKLMEVLDYKSSLK